MIFGPLLKNPLLNPLDILRFLLFGMEGQDDTGLLGKITVWTVLNWFSSLAMIVGGVLPYIPQYLKIKKTQNADGFSLYVCLTLLIANILRILFWFGNHYEIPLLIQSIFMNFTMLAIIQLCVKVKQSKQVIHGKEKLFTADGTGSSSPLILRDFDWRFFWKWTDFRSYLEFVAVFTLSASLLTYLLIGNVIFVEALGFTSLFIEAMLGIPQFYDNYVSKSTLGMSRVMVFLWLAGDSFKTLYFFTKQSPIQFCICGALQIAVDLAILSQTVWFGSTPGRRKGLAGSHVVQ
ncbi:solute carrier family 66 member 2-like isoform X1 [Daphnia carinata]|uniref:solute carrier family 66 member 2-like isoform X1 n=1 Tax=Daphnia carinata TaxID=120202 RepID=UPI00257C61E9|nr:solute carrier family 66 member 2-like isoform X1 [Daphnia carinata]